MIKKNTHTEAIDKFVGDNIRRLRLISGITRNELANRIYVTGQQLNKYELGQNRVSIGRLILIAKALGETVESFYKGLDIDFPMREKTKHQKICDELTNNFRKIRNTEHTRIINELVGSLVK